MQSLQIIYREVLTRLSTPPRRMVARVPRRGDRRVPLHKLPHGRLRQGHIVVDQRALNIPVCVFQHDDRVRIDVPMEDPRVFIQPFMCCGVNETIVLVALLST